MATYVTNLYSLVPAHSGSGSRFWSHSSHTCFHLSAVDRHFISFREQMRKITIQSWHSSELVWTRVFPSRLKQSIVFCVPLLVLHQFTLQIQDYNAHLHRFHRNHRPAVQWLARAQTEQSLWPSQAKQLGSCVCNTGRNPYRTSVAMISCSVCHTCTATY